MRIRRFCSFSKNECVYRIPTQSFLIRSFSVVAKERKKWNPLQNCTNKKLVFCNFLKASRFVCCINFSTEKNEVGDQRGTFETDEERSVKQNDLTRNESGISGISAIEQLLDETNSMIYINEICFKMDQSLLRCQNYEQVLSILITHRGALFLQNLITTIRILSGFVIEERKQKEEKFSTKGGYTKDAYSKDHSSDNLTNHLNKKETNILDHKMEETSLTKTEDKISDENPFDEIEKSVINTYRSVFDALGDEQLVKSENGFKKNRDISEIIISDERYNLLIDDIYKNRKHFDVVSICHILISLKVLNHKYFPLFNAFINPLKKFDLFIKEQFSINQNLASVNIIIQLLLESFNAYIWAGYYNLDIYNKLINSVLLNNFIILNKNIIDTHIAQLDAYPSVGYSYDCNYPLPIKQVLRYFNFNFGFNEELMKYFDRNQQLKKNSNLLLTKTESGWKNDIVQIEKDSHINEKKNNINNSNIMGVVCPIFISFDLFLKSLQIYQHVYTYNSLFFEACEKVIYYYTPYLTPNHLSIICNTFSKHNIRTKEHDRVFYHIAKILERNSEKFAHQHLYHILVAFKKVHLFFENCILLACKKFKVYFHYFYLTRQKAGLTLKEVSILMNALTYFNYSNKLIDEFIENTLNYLEDYIDEIDEETSINISYALVLSNLIETNTYLFSFIWRKIAKTTFWERRKSQICILWLSHMIQFRWMEFDLPKFCVLESLKIFFIKKKENLFSLKNVISKISEILNEFQIDHETFVDINCPYTLDIFIPKRREVFMLTQETARNDILRECGHSKIVAAHLKLFGYNAKFLNTKYFESLDEYQQRMHIWQVYQSF